MSADGIQLVGNDHHPYTSPPHMHGGQLCPAVRVWVVALHGVETGVAVSPPDHVELPLENGHSSSATGRGHGRDVGPLLGGGVIPGGGGREGEREEVMECFISYSLLASLPGILALKKMMHEHYILVWEKIIQCLISYSAQLSTGCNQICMPD